MLSGVIVDVAAIRDAYLGDAAAAAGLCKPKGGKKRKSADEAPQNDFFEITFYIYSLHLDVWHANNRRFPISPSTLTSFPLLSSPCLQADDAGEP